MTPGKTLGQNGPKAHKSNMYQLPELSFEKCDHNRAYAACMICQARDLDVSTDHKLTKAFYPRFATFIRTGPGNDEEQNTPELVRKHFEEIWKQWPQMLWKKKATFFDTMIYYNDHLVDEMPDNSWFRKWLYLSAMFYDVRSLTNLKIPKLTPEEISDIEYKRSFIFSHQVSRLRDNIRYSRYSN